MSEVVIPAAPAMVATPQGAAAPHGEPEPLSLEEVAERLCDPASYQTVYHLT